MRIGWRDGMQRALYGEGGFFRTGPAGPGGHFRTSVHASPLFAGALMRLVERIDLALGHPDPFDVVDVGAGRGEFLTALARLAGHADAGPAASGPASGGPASGGPAAWGPASGGRAVGPSAGAGRAAGPAVPVPGLAERLRLTAVEIAPRPAGLPADIAWRPSVPDRIVGLLVATEWLDNVPLDVVEVADDGTIRRVLVDQDTGDEWPGGPVDPADVFWLARWWPLADRPAGTRAEIGWPRDIAWADAVAAVQAGCALAVDYGHLRADRPLLGSMTGYRDGRQVRPVPDGRSDVTAHVAMDSVAAAAGTAYTLVGQRAALRALGVDGARPPLDLAGTDPPGYVRALSAAGAAAELTDPAGLGGHWWLLHGIGVDVPLRAAQSSATASNRAYGPGRTHGSPIR